MNDNDTYRRVMPPRLALIEAGLPDKPDPCFCGSDDTFVDAPTSPNGSVGPYHVTCAHCGAEGPDARLYIVAVARWNALISSNLYIVDNTTC
jgi:hypothetical protein